MTRKNDRQNNEMRSIEIEVGVNKHAEGSALIKFGDTHVICTASIENQVPRWMRGSNEGWITAEYGMLPRSTNERMNREATRGKQSGRTMEIQRLIGRSLRQAVDLKYLKDILKEIFSDLKNEKLKQNIILFSPAGASFDSFKNFEDRGKYFNQLIKKFLNAK